MADAEMKVPGDGADEIKNDPRVPAELNNNVFIATLDKIYNWGRKRSMWPMLFGLACCAIEMICTAAAKYDLARFGWELMRPSPRQADLMIVSGTVTKKMVPQIVRLFNQMPQPRYVISMGACATGGGPFKEGYNVVSGIDKFIPVDVYIPGCPPRPEALMHGFIKLQEKIEKQSVRTVPWYRSGEDDVVPQPLLGPDLVNMKRATEIAERTKVNPPAAAELSAQA
jgi:NADH-quinone oxidoreductase subunit B